ncbi:hypothetical protein L3Q82_010100 [Scortum barcoo]|uniref:Uncharacterized protein n=1 Tax=Scortum barcoo TaxID=214431 RepID=A0ACB8WB87_9TELE|nr:hypothetical protein L3Q82_010100 [Scortum barcoo]
MAKEATFATREVTGLLTVPREKMTAVTGMPTPIGSLSEPRGRRGHVEREGATLQRQQDKGNHVNSSIPLKQEAIDGITPVFSSLLQAGVIVPCN